VRARQVEIRATVESADVVQSPMPGSSANGAAIELEVTEGGTTLGSVLLGDVLALRTESGAIVRIVTRHATVRFDPDEGTAVPLAQGLPEIVPILRRATGAGPIAVRERVLRKGDVVRLHAFLEGDSVVRDDRGPVVLEVVRMP
jgi:hypothetical protein